MCWSIFQSMLLKYKYNLIFRSISPSKANKRTVTYEGQSMFPNVRFLQNKLFAKTFLIILCLRKKKNKKKTMKIFAVISSLLICVESLNLTHLLHWFFHLLFLLEVTFGVRIYPLLKRGSIRSALLFEDTEWYWCLSWFSFENVHLCLSILMIS